MEEILEIRDGCSTPAQLLKSKAFAKYLEIYKKQFINELKKRDDSKVKEEVLHKIEYIKNIEAKLYISILEGVTPFSRDELRDFRDAVQFLDGAFHHYRTKSYTRLVRLHNEVIEKSLNAEQIKDKVSSKAEKLSDLLIETRRILLIKVGLGEGVRRTKGLDCHPNVAVGEISGHFVKLPGDYSNLNQARFNPNLTSHGTATVPAATQNLGKLTHQPKQACPTAESSIQQIVASQNIPHCTLRN